MGEALGATPVHKNTVRSHTATMPTSKEVDAVVSEEKAVAAEPSWKPAWDKGVGEKLGLRRKERSEELVSY